jgi:hypothetical protein
VDKDGLLKSIAETGYNVGFGAKKHFATFDIIEKMPGFIGFVSIAVGIFSLVYEPLSTKLPSACLTIAGVCAVYIGLYNHRKSEYERAGIELTKLFNELKVLYRSVQAGADVTAGVGSLRTIESNFYGHAISNQIVFSDWYAHYKFFAQQQIDWVDEQKKFTWRDKFPLSLILTALIVVGLIVWLIVANLKPDVV